MSKITLLCFLPISVLISTANAQVPFKVGDLFPTINLPSLADGQAASIQDYRGQKIILHVFASW
ncbi:MAG: hypothetical protein ACE5G1_16585 [bacterium]